MLTLIFLSAVYFTFVVIAIASNAATLGIDELIMIAYHVAFDIFAAYILYELYKNC